MGGVAGGNLGGGNSRSAKRAGGGVWGPLEVDSDGSGAFSLNLIIRYSGSQLEVTLPSRGHLTTSKIAAVLKSGMRVRWRPEMLLSSLQCPGGPQHRELPGRRAAGLGRRSPDRGPSNAVEQGRVRLKPFVA